MAHRWKKRHFLHVVDEEEVDYGLEEVDAKLAWLTTNNSFNAACFFFEWKKSLFFFF